MGNKDLQKELVMQGRLIESGWESLKETLDFDEAPAFLQNEMRQSFFEGVKYMVNTLRKASTTIENQTIILDLIREELREFNLAKKPKEK